MKLLQYLLDSSPAVPAIEAQADWWPDFLAQASGWGRTLEQAAVGGFRADRLAWAFCAGYQSALRRLFPGLAADRMATFCATEAGGNGPKAIMTRLAPDGDGWQLSGEKSWGSIATPESVLYVVARTNDPAAPRPELRVAEVPAGAPGVSILAMPPPGFVPEVSHARIVLQGVPVAARNLLPGDGYDGYLKPFRAVEDMHVTSAVLGCLVREARTRQWPRTWVQRVLAVLLGFQDIDGRDFASPHGHIALAGALGLAGELIAQVENFWAEAPPDDPARRRWARDRRLLEVASAARKARIESAWQRIAR